MNVLAYDPYLSATEMAARGGEKVELDDLAAPVPTTSRSRVR